jgi:ABC-type Mn2+/Zn2+ transport system ATPase subunit
MVPGMDPEQNCNIDAGSATAKLLREAKLLVMDEVTMMSKVDLHRIDRTLQFLMDNRKPFGGKVVLLSGDFRQVF